MLLFNRQKKIKRKGEREKERNCERESILYTLYVLYSVQHTGKLAISNLE